MHTLSLYAHTKTQGMEGDGTPLGVGGVAGVPTDKEEAGRGQDTIEAAKEEQGDDNLEMDMDKDKEKGMGDPAGAGGEKCELSGDDKEALHQAVAAAAAAAIEEWGDVEEQDEGEEEEEARQQREDGADGKASAAFVTADGEEEEGEEEEEEEIDLAPHPAPPSPVQQLPPFWATAQCFKTKATYYYNQKTGHTAWEPPPLLPPSLPPSYPRLAPIVPSSAPQLPHELAKLHAALDKVCGWREGA